MDSDKLVKMYSEIVNGVDKEQSEYVSLDPEADALWDSIEGEVAAIRTATPGVVFSIPNEIPDASEDGATLDMPPPTGFDTPPETPDAEPDAEPDAATAPPKGKPTPPEKPDAGKKPGKAPPFGKKPDDDTQGDKA